MQITKKDCYSRSLFPIKCICCKVMVIFNTKQEERGFQDVLKFSRNQNLHKLNTSVIYDHIS